MCIAVPLFCTFMLPSSLKLPAIPHSLSLSTFLQPHFCISTDFISLHAIQLFFSHPHSSFSLHPHLISLLNSALSLHTIQTPPTRLLSPTMIHYVATRCAQLVLSSLAVLFAHSLASALCVHTVCSVGRLTRKLKLDNISHHNEVNSFAPFSFSSFRASFLAAFHLVDIVFVHVCQLFFFCSLSLWWLFMCG